jgi:hypothetical protein
LGTDEGTRGSFFVAAKQKGGNSAEAGAFSEMLRYYGVAMTPQKIGFVIMPFSPTKSEDNWTEVFSEVFQPALTECGYTCTRAEVSTGSLITSIVERLIEADIVIVDATDRNANVFYELGVRHALRRGTIIVSKGTEHVPSDLRGYWFLSYGLRPAEVKAFKSEIKRVIEAIEKEPQRSDNPVSDYLDKTHLSSVREINRDNLKKLGAFITELTGNRLAIRQQISTKKQQLFSIGCLQLLLQTRYLDVGPELLKACYELEYRLEILRRDTTPSRTLLDSTLHEVDVVISGVSSIRDDVAKGEFFEPTTVSMMTWSPLENRAKETPVSPDRSCESFAEDEGDREEARLERESELNYSCVEPGRGFCMSCGESAGLCVCNVRPQRD